MPALINASPLTVVQKIVFLVVVLLLGITTSCSTADSSDSATKVPANATVVKGAGATFPSVLYKKWLAVYASVNPKVAITYDVVGSGEGTTRFIGLGIKEENTLDFGASDAAMTDEQMAQVPEGVVLLPATAGSLVLVYNIPDVQNLRLSRQAYAGIFLGEITNWNEPRIAVSNPGVVLPNITIAPVVRQDGSGTTYAFTNHLDAINKVWHDRYGPATLIDWPGNAMRARGNEGVAARVQLSVGAIGYVGYEFARNLSLPVATLENRQGNFISPTKASGEAALAEAEFPENLRIFLPDPLGPDAYPIVTFSWILLRKNYPDTEKGNAIRNFFQWCLQEGQGYASDLGYIGLSPEVSAKALSALSTVKSGL